MKTKLLFVAVLAFGLMGLARAGFATCFVANEKDESSKPYNVSSLRQMVTQYNSGGDEAVCNIPDDWGDDSTAADFDQVIYFFTEEWDLLDDGVINYVRHVNDDGSDEDTDPDWIVLVDSLTFNNGALSLVVGNWSPDTTPIWTDENYGTALIDAETNELKKVFKCGSRQADGSVTLRNLTIRTKGITYEDLFADAPCLVDGGAVTVEASGTTPTTEPDTDEDGDGYYVDGNDDGDCDDKPETSSARRRMSSGGDGPTSSKRSGPTDNCDCDDTNADINPGETEICADSVDNDCDEQVDEGCEGTTGDTDDDGDGYYNDDDGDGDWNDSTDTTIADCDDADFSVNPAATEVCGDGIDNNCDGVSAEAGDYGCDTDADGDGYFVEINDCNDSADDVDLNGEADGYAVNPGADEYSFGIDGIDNDCDGDIDDADDDWPDLNDVDDDGDGYTENEGDCDDTDATINPDADEYSFGVDDIDNDCDGSVDENFVGEITDDDDGDGFCEDSTACADETATPGDCDDSTDTVSPSTVDICDGIDNNCRNGVDEGCEGEPTVDDDGDGYCEAVDACADSTILPGDCDDTGDDADGDGVADGFTINPGAEEICSDNADTDCNGMDDSLDPLCVENPDDGTSGASSGCGCDVTASRGSANYFELLLGFLALASMRILRARKSV